MIFDGKNQKEIMKFLSANGFSANVAPNGKLSVDLDGEETIIFKDDDVAIKGGKLSIKKPSYVGATLNKMKIGQTIVAKEQPYCESCGTHEDLVEDYRPSHTDDEGEWDGWANMISCKECSELEHEDWWAGHKKLHKRGRR